MSLRFAFWALAVLTFAATAWVVWDETVTRRPWKETQERFQKVLAERGQKPVPEGIRQITNPALGVADRCQTCHLAVEKAGFESPELPLEFRTHPRRETLLGSKHPVEQIGCTACHRGQGLQTKGVAGAKFDHGRDDPYWEKPLATRPFIQSSCVTCHTAEHEIPQAEHFNRGRFLFEERRCYGCHSSRHFSSKDPAAPPLNTLREKTSEEFVKRWLKKPAEQRAHPRMPAFWPDERYAQRDGEIAAVATYLGSTPQDALPQGDDTVRPELAEEGRALFDGLGCRGCHTVEKAEGGKEAPEARFGPSLDRTGERTTARWLRAWLRKPKTLWAETRMPDLRLAEDEVERLVAYLVSLRGDGVAPAESKWSPADPARAQQGRDLVLKYGCNGCHRIPGLEAAGRPGPDLDNHGDLPPERLEWGDEPVACDRPALECWTLTKVKTPRRMREAKETPLMPQFDLSDDDALALSVFLMSNREGAALPRRLNPAQQAQADGERVLARRNCRACHEVGRDEERVLDDDGELVEVRYRPRGGDVRRFYAEPALAPPPLTFAGSKFQYEWLHGFLSAPERLRPWLASRMPSFELSPEETATLTKYFAAADNRPWPFDPNAAIHLAADERADAKVLFEKFQCAKCHGVSTLPGVKTAERAPDLALSVHRLKNGWLARWLEEPQQVQPGTRMPSYFPLFDEDDPTSLTTPYPKLLGGSVKRQIEALVALTMGFGAPAPVPEKRVSERQGGKTP